MAKGLLFACVSLVVMARGAVAVGTLLENQLTIRVNTFRRLDLIKSFLDYYQTCEVIKQVQVVWSDQVNSPPMEWLQNYPTGKYMFEVHMTDSLNNRFRVLDTVPTEAVLSIDDDLIVPCEDLANALLVWKANKNVLVGFSPRMTLYDIVKGNQLYLNWQYTWWSGVYTIMLTKAAIMHRDYLPDYDKLVPKEMLDHVDSHRNCEDIAMAHAIARQSNAAPVWVHVIIYEVSTGGISSGASHFQDRSNCVDVLKKLTHVSPWVTGYQKVVAITYSDFFRYWWMDNK